MNARPVRVCAECYDLDCKVHGEHLKEYQCQICIDTHPTAYLAEQCCRHRLDTSVLDASHLAKEVKKKRDPTLEFPEQALKGRRDK